MLSARIERIIEETFGVTYHAGFDNMLRSIEEDLHIAPNTLTICEGLNDYKWQILDEATRRGPYDSNMYEMAYIITFITDGLIVYDDEDLDNYTESLDSLTP